MNLYYKAIGHIHVFCAYCLCSLTLQLELETEFRSSSLVNVSLSLTDNLCADKVKLYHPAGEQIDASCLGDYMRIHRCCGHLSLFVLHLAAVGCVYL